MSRRRFDHLFTELCVAVDLPLPRYELWLALHEARRDPERLSREEVLSFCEVPLKRFLRERGLRLEGRDLGRLLRRLRRFDPAVPTPEERFAAFPG